VSVFIDGSIEWNGERGNALTRGRHLLAEIADSGVMAVQSEVDTDVQGGRPL